MAQDGDTITYTHSPSDGTVRSEDVSSVDEMTIDYIIGASAASQTGGLVENVVVDLSGYNTIYLWLAGNPTFTGSNFGRYYGGAGLYNGAGSTEVSFINTDRDDSEDEPFIAGAGGGYQEGFSVNGGARGGGGSYPAEGIAPPQGGDDSTPSDGAVSNIPEIKDSGTTTEEGGPFDAVGEIKISYRSTLSPPDPPSNLSATVQ